MRKIITLFLLLAAATAYGQPASGLKPGPPKATAKKQAAFMQAAHTAGEKNDSVALRQLQQTIQATLRQEAPRFAALAYIRYLQAQPTRNWAEYATATAAYGQHYAAQDSQTIYETALDINASCENPAVIRQGEQLVQQVLMVRLNYDNMLLHAQLLRKMQKPDAALVAATEAVAVAAKDKVDAAEATALIAELKAAKTSK
jgi:hypothetical protein